MDKYACVICGHVYDPEIGDPTGKIAPGINFEDIPEDWVCPLCEFVKTGFVMIQAVKSKDIPRKIYIQYAGKEIVQDDLIEKFKFEWCKEYKITELNNFRIYYKIEDEKAYFVANKSITIAISF